MIQQTIPTWQVSDWKGELAGAVTSARELLLRLDLADSPLAGRVLGTTDFPVRVPVPYLSRMRRGDPDDPLLRQVLPLAEEERSTPGFDTDPLQESRHNPVPGVVHKYRGRLLLVVSPVCAINCRYCFRRHFPYRENTLGKREWRQALDYIAGDNSIREVILSGGDPLATGDEHLRWLVDAIAGIPHVERLRVHTRLPVVIPGRIDERCLAWLTGTRLRPVMVLHINHGNEIDNDVAAMAARLRQKGVVLLNQAVLLRGVNDSAEALESLSEKLFAAGILPYYLHLMDPVAGAGHFDVPEKEALRLYAALQARVSGYLLPKLVREIPGATAKTQVGHR